jgi:DnaJ-class molecular chaperone
MSEAMDAPCPDCRGTGQIALLTSVQVCQKCRGTGRPHSDAASRMEKIENGYRLYDSKNRPVLEATIVEAEMTLCEYPPGEPPT